MPRLLTCLTAAAVAAAMAAESFGQLHPDDIFLDVEDGAIVTGAINQHQTLDVPVRVFRANFGDSGFDGFTSDPGFDTFPGTFPTGTAIGFNALAGWKVWNGEGFEASDGESLLIWFGSAEVTVADDPTSGFAINVQPDGGWHRHLNYAILGPNSESPLPGIYLLELELFNTSPSIGTSEPFWKVFNYNMPASVHDEAVEWVEQNMLDDDDCLGDLDGSGVVDGSDLLILLGAWGPCNGDCPADLNGDGVVDGGDLLILLGAWGACPD